MPDEITPEAIGEAAANPQSATVDGQTVASHSLPDQITAHEYVSAAAQHDATNPQGGKRSGWNSLRIARAIPPGAQ